MADFHFQSKKVKVENVETAEPILIIDKVLDIARSSGKEPKTPNELSQAFLSIRTYLNKIREDVKNSPALEHLKETQELEFKVLSKQLEMKKALIDRYSKHKLTEEIDLLTEEL